MTWAQVYPWLITPRVLRGRPFVFGGCLFLIAMMFLYLCLVGFAVEWDLMVLTFFGVAWAVCATVGHFRNRT